MYAQKQLLQCTPPPTHPTQPFVVVLFMSWKTVLLCFRTWGMGGQNIQEVRELDRLPEAGTPEGSLTAINSLPIMEAYRPLLPQNVLQAGL